MASNLTTLKTAHVLCCGLYSNHHSKWKNVYYIAGFVVVHSTCIQKRYNADFRAIFMIALIIYCHQCIALLHMYTNYSLMCWQYNCTGHVLLIELVLSKQQGACVNDAISCLQCTFYTIHIIFCILLLLQSTTILLKKDETKNDEELLS